MGEKGEGSGGEGGGKWGERGRELGMGYPPVHPLGNGSCLSTIYGIGSTQLSDTLMSYRCSDIFLTFNQGLLYLLKQSSMREL